MKGNFGLYVVPTGTTTEVFKIDYSTGKTWRYTLGQWQRVLDAS